MERRNYLKIIAGGSPFLLLPNNQIFGKNTDSTEWLEPFKVRWQNSEIYCHEIFEAMPASDYNFRPTSDVMSFGKLFSHIGYSLNIYGGVFDGTAPEDEPLSDDKADVLEYLDNGFGHFNDTLEKINADELFTNNHQYPDKEPWKDFNITDIMILAYNHTIHHTAQATVYLRLKNITPPKYRF